MVHTGNMQYLWDWVWYCQVQSVSFMDLFQIYLSRVLQMNFNSWIRHSIVNQIHILWNEGDSKGILRPVQTDE